MKKLFTILCTTVLTLSVTAQAQFGIKAGFNSSAIGSSDTDWNEFMSNKIGVQIGGVATIPFGDVVQLRTGAIYNQKGATLELSNANDGLNWNDVILAVDYLEVPADFAFMLGDGGFALSAGPYFAFLLSGKRKIDGESDEDMEDVNTMDIGLNLGASYTIAENMIIDARYGMGLTNVADTDETDDIWLNGCLSVSFAYMFGG